MTLAPPSGSDELFRFKMHRDGPEGFLPCTRQWPHAGPCAHPPKDLFGPTLEFLRDYEGWQSEYRRVLKRYTDAMPCLDSNCGYRNPTCWHCTLAIDATKAIVGPGPDPRDYRPEEELE